MGNNFCSFGSSIPFCLYTFKSELLVWSRSETITIVSGFSKFNSPWIIFIFFIPLQIVETLLTNGAHIDSRNGRGQRPLDMLKHIPDCKINPLMYLTLRCLAASVIAQNKLPYKREIPTILEEFIESH